MEASRVVLWARMSQEEKEAFMDGKLQASHLCHESMCITDSHIIAETKEENEARKSCSKQLRRASVVIGGKVVELESTFTCEHEPKCIPKIIDMRVSE